MLFPNESLGRHVKVVQKAVVKGVRITATIVRSADAVSFPLAFHGAAPNPFTGATTIAYSVPATARVRARCSMCLPRRRGMACET